MKGKIISILIMTLLIAATVLPAAGIITITTKKVEKPLSHDTIIEQELEDTPEINKPDGTTSPRTATKTGYLSVPAAAFIPEKNTVEYFGFGSFLEGIGWFYTPVYLPHEATVSEVNFYWSDLSVGIDTKLILVRYPMGGAEEEMALVETSGSSGDGFSIDNTIDFADIDNAGYSYFLGVGLHDDITYFNALITYTYETGGGSGDMDNNQQSQSNLQIYPNSQPISITR
jgi:hypothetical protein